MRNPGQSWSTLRRLLAYGSLWRKPLGGAVIMLWVAAAAEVTGPALISYFIDNLVAKNQLPLGLVAGSRSRMCCCKSSRRGCTTGRRCCLTRRRSAWCNSCEPM